MISKNTKELIESSTLKLIDYIESESFRGYDPYDALNSPIIKFLSNNSKWLKIGATQILRKMPINLRPLLLISKDYNPKGMGLLLCSYVKLYKLYRDMKFLKEIGFLADWLINNHSAGYSGHCWGYNFDWQNRSFFAPKGMPTIVNTAFIGHAFLDAYEILKIQKYLDVARSSCNFIMNDLNIHHDSDTICFSYTPSDCSRVHNANYLGASLLIRTFSFTQEDILLDFGKKAYEYSSNAQNDDGSWFYGEAEYQKWIDNFHTGFNLDALYIYKKYLNSNQYDFHIKRGLKFYIDNFFLRNGIPKYYQNSIYPIDIHCSAQAIITLTKFKDWDPNIIALLINLLEWTIRNMQSQKGFFYFRRQRFFLNKISYIRWGQAWMMHALTDVLLLN